MSEVKEETLAGKLYKNLISLAKEAKELGCGIYFNKEASNGYWYFYFTQDFWA
jgi:hypothetical protein